jgi:hypothetical protein
VFISEIYGNDQFADILKRRRCEEIIQLFES